MGHKAMETREAKRQQCVASTIHIREFVILQILRVD
jgi:hypothetical protein